MLNVNLCSFREANKGDAALVYSWRVQPEIAQQMNTAISGEFDTHLKWFNREMNNESRRMFIIQYDNIDIGFFTFYDLNYTVREGTFSWYIGNTAYRKKGLGSAILRLFLVYFRDKLHFNTLKCEVKKSNIHALDLYLQNGFVLELACDKNKYFLVWESQNV